MEVTPTLFEPFGFANGLTLRNRVVMAPMTTWSANDDGTVSDEEVSYYRRRVNGVGLVLTGCTHVSPNGIGFTGEFASYDDSFTPSLRRLAEAAKSGGAPAILQIFHAGNKAVPELIPGGEVVSASSLQAPVDPFNAKEVTTRALSHDEILDLISAFGETTRRAIEAGFDGVELHGAHGFLIQNFFSPLYNQRDDEWGGSPENRMRFPLAVVREVKRVIRRACDASVSSGVPGLARGTGAGRPSHRGHLRAYRPTHRRRGTTTSMRHCRTYRSQAARRYR